MEGTWQGTRKPCLPHADAKGCMAAQVAWPAASVPEFGALEDFTEPHEKLLRPSSLCFDSQAHSMLVTSMTGEVRPQGQGTRACLQSAATALCMQCDRVLM